MSSTETIQGYAAAMPYYYNVGWRGILPLPYLKKSPPPTGFTGEFAPDPTDAQLSAWVRDNPMGNTALRIPLGVVGIDVDDYAAKRGDTSLTDRIAAWGPLPATWSSTSRGSSEGPGPSRQLFYRLPDHRKLAGKVSVSIEALQHHHRYACVWPSYNPDADGAQYRWFDPAGVMVPDGVVPRVEWLEVLPAPWFAGLQEGAASAGIVAASDAEGYALLEALRVDDREQCAKVEGLLRWWVDALEEPGAARHDAGRDGCHALIHAGVQGHGGAAEALGELREVFEAVTGGGGTREAEWARLELGSARKVAAEFGVAPVATTCMCGWETEMANRLFQARVAVPTVDDSGRVVVPVPVPVSTVTGPQTAAAAPWVPVVPPAGVGAPVPAAPALGGQPVAPTPLPVPPPVVLPGPAGPVTVPVLVGTAGGDVDNTLSTGGDDDFDPKSIDLPKLAGTGGPKPSLDVWRLTNHLHSRVVGTRARYCPDLGGWLVYNGVHWIAEENAELVLGHQIRSWTSSIADAWGDLAAPFGKIPADKLTGEQRYIRGQAGMWATARQNAPMAGALVMLRERLFVAREMFDADPWKLNTRSGLVDLRNGAMEPHAPEHLCTTVTLGGYYTSALAPDGSVIVGPVTHPRWTQILAAVPEDCLAWWQRRIGQAASGFGSHDDAAVFAYGSGANGKSVLIDVLVQTLAGYAVTPERVMLMGGSGSAREASLARSQLVGKRLAIIEELPESGYLDSNQLKEVVGTPRLSFREHYRKGTEAKASHSIIVTTNHLPSLSTSDDASWRRLLAMHFDRVFVMPGVPVVEAHERAGDTTLKPYLAGGAEPAFWDAVTTWIVQGAVAHFSATPEQQHERPQAIVSATAAWASRANPLTEWVIENLEAAPPDQAGNTFYVTTSEVYQAYVQEMQAIGAKPLGQAKFNIALPQVAKREFGVTTWSDRVRPQAGRWLSTRGTPTQFAGYAGAPGAPARLTQLAAQGAHWAHLRWSGAVLVGGSPKVG